MSTITLPHWRHALGFLAGLNERLPLYREALFWADRPEWAKVAAAQLYSCGLTARAALRLAGGDVAPPLGGPYEGRNDVITRLVQAARRHGVAKAGPFFGPHYYWAREGGRVLVVGANGDQTTARGGAPACEHVVCTFGPTEDAGGVYTVEGGQRDAEGVDSIQPFRRRLVRIGAHLWLLDADENRGRRVTHAFDALGWPAEEK